jgi:hypothetical protein
VKIVAEIGVINVIKARNSKDSQQPAKAMKESGTELPSQPSKGTHLVNTWILNFWHPEL